MKTIIRFSLSSWMLVAGGCGEDGSSPLERGDVQNIGEGDAEGSELTGLYTFTSFDVTRCHCRNGSSAFDCSTVSLTAEGFAIEQHNGFLAAEGVFGGHVVSEVRYTGGVDADGAFRLGAVLDVTGAAGATIGSSLNHLEGAFDGTGRIDLEMRTRLEAIVDGTSVDCDIDFDIAGSRSN
jgi:hypothetical protein